MDDHKAYFSYSAIEDELDSLKHQLDHEDYQPDAVISINRGGNLVGMEMSHHYNVPLGIIDIDHYSDQEQQEQVSIGESMLEKVEGDVLLVDDIADTGKTLKEAEKLLEDKERIDSIRSATLHCKTDTHHQPDLYSTAIEPDTWVVYPWEPQ
ncbi:MAG: phosphoribosyltransferase family protein [Candidatus Nanohaloarchaea archaeon]|nr:phosphoribosyltransferase family protein [Candidatus Nanohaloarchaea archaeon]